MEHASARQEQTEGEITMNQEVTGLLKYHASLSQALLSSSAVRSELMSEIAAVSGAEYKLHYDSFLHSLSEFNRSVYCKAIETPYAAKDWWRDAHDIFVTWSLATIVREENQICAQGASNALLPEWLITAALLHDRGYAILTSQNTQSARDYSARQGAFWENVDTRQRHALLSREFADALLFSPQAAVPGFLPLSDREDFLTVIERHDYPLIGRYQELPEVGQHHFDADSLYSISLISFVKDYLSYLGDQTKIERVNQSGLCAPAEFFPQTLLAIRMARYFASPEQLPKGWNLDEFPLRPEAAQLAEGGMLMRPVTESALQMTGDSFVRLAQCCRQLAGAESLDEFLSWFVINTAAQFRELRMHAVPTENKSEIQGAQ